jgi:hypothetical protein
MPNLDKRKVKSNLLKKGFILKEGTNHEQLVYLDKSGALTASRTVLSRGENDISKSLVSKMARDVNLNTSQFTDLVECTLEKKGYNNILVKKGIVDPGDLPNEDKILLSNENIEKIKKRIEDIINEGVNSHEVYKIYGMLNSGSIKQSDLDVLNIYGIKLE